MNLLNLIIVVPILAAIAVLFGAPTRKTSLAAAAINLALCLALYFSYDKTANGFQFISSFPIIESIDLKYLVGIDGLNLMLLLLTAIVTFCAIWVAPVTVEKMPRLFYACLLFIAAGAFGAFASLDLFFFYMFHELALIPTFLLIGIWGTGDRQLAAWKITLYLALGSFVLLIGLLALFWAIPADLRTFDMIKLLAAAKDGLIPVVEQKNLFLILLIGFGILISLFPFHSWAPQAYASAPVPATMLHAGVLKKFGLYGLIRVALPLLPEGAQHWTDLLLVLLIGNILYVGFVTIAQKRLDTMLGYSSVMHMGYVFLGIASMNSVGLSGASLMMFAHGISIAVLFALAGQIRKRTATLEFSELGGLAKSAPFLGICFGLAAFASIGLPGFANFPAEMSIFFGAFGSSKILPAMTSIQFITFLALWGLVISAVYMLRAYRTIFMGESSSRCTGVGDCNGSARIPLILLLTVLIFIGFFPNILLDLINPVLSSLSIAK